MVHASFQAAREYLAARLASAGVAATVDTTAVPPMVVVGIPDTIRPLARVGWECTIPVWIVAPAAGGPDGVVWILGQLPAALPALGRSVTEANPDEYPVNGKPCPSYRIDVASVRVSDPSTCPS